MFTLQAFSVSVPFLDRPARPVQAFDAFEAAQRVARQLPTPAPVVVACRCNSAPTTLAAYVRGGSDATAPGYIFQAQSVAFQFQAGQRDGVARVEVLVPGQCCFSVSYQIDADGVVTGLTSEGAGQLLLHIKGRTCVQEFSEYLAMTVERAFVAGKLTPSKAAASPLSEAASVAAAHNQASRAGLIPG